MIASKRVISNPAIEKKGLVFCFFTFTLMKGFSPKILPIRLAPAHNATSPIHKITSLPIMFLSAQFYNYLILDSKSVRAAVTRAALFSAIVPFGINSEFSNPTRTFPPSDTAF